MATQINNLHAFSIKYLGATNTKGSRVKIISERFNQSVTIPYNYDFNNSIDIAIDYLSKKGYNLTGQAEMTKFNHVILSDTFKPLKDAKQEN